MSLKQEPSLHLGTLRPLSRVPRSLETGTQVLPTSQCRANSDLRSSGKEWQSLPQRGQPILSLSYPLTYASAWASSTGASVRSPESPPDTEPHSSLEPDNEATLTEIPSPLVPSRELRTWIRVSIPACCTPRASQNVVSAPPMPKSVVGCFSLFALLEDPPPRSQIKHTESSYDLCMSSLCLFLASFS